METFLAKMRRLQGLRKVNKLVRDARKVHRCMLLVGEISDIYVDGYRRRCV